MLLFPCFIVSLFLNSNCDAPSTVDGVVIFRAASVNVGWTVLRRSYAGFLLFQALEIGVEARQINQPDTANSSGLS